MRKEEAGVRVICGTEKKERTMTREKEKQTGKQRTQYERFYQVQLKFPFSKKQETRMNGGNK